MRRLVHAMVRMSRRNMAIREREREREIELSSKLWSIVVGGV